MALALVEPGRFFKLTFVLWNKLSSSFDPQPAILDHYNIIKGQRGQPWCPGYIQVNSLSQLAFSERTCLARHLAGWWWRQATEEKAQGRMQSRRPTWGSQSGRLKRPIKRQWHHCMIREVWNKGGGGVPRQECCQLKCRKGSLQRWALCWAIKSMWSSWQRRQQGRPLQAEETHPDNLERKIKITNKKLMDCVIKILNVCSQKNSTIKKINRQTTD